MKLKKVFIGIDVSKKKLDVTVVEDPNSKKHHHFIVSNCKEGIAEIFTKTKALGIKKKQLVICFEHTGVYTMPLCFYLQQKDIEYSMVPAIEIYRSRGLVRGKSDKTDSRDIAFYAVTHQHKLQATKLPETKLMRLRVLLTQRNRLVKVIGSFQRSNEISEFMPKKLIAESLKINKKAMSQLKKHLKKVDLLIKELIEEDDQLSNVFNLARSVPGVGKSTAAYLIAFTRAFTTFNDWRKLACYAGIAPFEYSSGSSIRGKTQVNNMANKQLKSLLNMAAITAIRWDPQLKDYYERTVAEGKNKMLVINAVRCKVVSRVFATVKRGTPYVKLESFS